VILDHRLPDRFGLDILPEIHTLQPSVPVILMTGFGSKGLCASAFKLGIKDYLSKPVHRNDLIAAVCPVLGNSSEVAGQPGNGRPNEHPLTRAQRPSDVLIKKAVELIDQRYRDGLRLSTRREKSG
jgi:FixJ family two-component response regulator